MLKNKIVLTSLLLCLLPTFSYGEVQEENSALAGLEIAVERYKRFKGYGDYRLSMEMTIKSERGETTAFRMRSMALEVQDDGDKSIIIFDSPKDQKGIALLSHTHRDGPDDQILYLPSIKRLKRISSSNKSGPFMGSEFAYEDLSSKEVEKASYRYLRTEILNGVTCFVTERVAKSKTSGYTRMIVWTDKDHYRIHKADYYDRKDALLKTLEYKEYELHRNRFWRAKKAVMSNHQTDKVTTIVYANYEFTTGLSENDFSRNALKRVH